MKFSSTRIFFHGYGELTLKLSSVPTKPKTPTKGLFGCELAGLVRPELRRRCGGFEGFEGAKSSFGSLQKECLAASLKVPA